MILQGVLFVVADLSLAAEQFCARDIALRLAELFLVCVVI
jgi:hypothetical protein